jgi:ATP-dependent RNA helicase RhlE
VRATDLGRQPSAATRKDPALTTFTELELNPALLRSLAAEGYTTPTPIQVQAIPSVRDGRDLLGIAQTGTGKTAAFALPILHRLAQTPRPTPRRGARVLVLAPTRELASQIAQSFRTYGHHLGVGVGVVFGGVAHRPQVQMMARGLDVLVATPGRLLDHMGEGTITLATTEILVLDEADQMMDLGFIRPLRQIVAKLPARRQTLFFSATMPQEIGQLADELLREPVKVAVTPVAKTVDGVAQKAIFVETPRKRALLVELFADPALSRALVFTRTKRGADKVARHLEEAGIAVAAIHGNKSQGQRERALGDFKASRIRALVATDIAARGIDIDEVSHVVNFELPNIPESYVHRIGRTARAGAQGIAISLVDGEERVYLRDIERLIRQQIASEDRRADRGLAASADRRPAAHEGRGERGAPQGSRHGRTAEAPGRPRGNGWHANGAARPAHATRRVEGRSTETAEGRGRHALGHIGFLARSGPHAEGAPRPQRQPGDRRETGGRRRGR